MKANELRINNIVGIQTNVLYETKINGLESCIVKSINKNLTVDLESIDYPKTTFINCSIFKPIPLTEEILLKCGFEFADDNHIFWIKGAFNLEKSDDNKFWFEVYDHYNEIKYLHQLQNLYFALTGTELKVNL